MGKWKSETFSEEDGAKILTIAEKVTDFMESEVEKLGYNEEKKILAHYLIVQAIARATDDTMGAVGMKLRIRMRH